MPTFRAIGVSTSPAPLGFTALVRFVQIDEGETKERVLSEQKFTVADKPALRAKCDEQLAILKKSYQDAARAADIAGKVLGETKA